MCLPAMPEMAILFRVLLYLRAHMRSRAPTTRIHTSYSQIDTSLAFRFHQQSFGICSASLSEAAMHIADSGGAAEHQDGAGGAEAAGHQHCVREDCLPGADAL